MEKFRSYYLVFFFLLIYVMMDICGLIFVWCLVNLENLDYFCLIRLCLFFGVR